MPRKSKSAAPPPVQQGTAAAPPAPPAPESTVGSTVEVESVVESVVESAIASVASTSVARKKRPRKAAATKRTPSSYVLFSMQHRKSILEKDPLLKLPDISRECGRAWKALSDVERKPWDDEAAALKQARSEQLVASMADQPAKKKKPMTSFLLFSREQSKQVKAATPDMRMGDVAKEVGARWRALATEEKDAWKSKAAELKAAA